MDHLSEVYGGLDGGFPLVTFSRASLDTVVISPLGHFMDVNQASWKTSKGARVFGFGPLGSLQQVCMRGVEGGVFLCACTKVGVVCAWTACV